METEAIRDAEGKMEKHLQSRQEDSKKLVRELVVLASGESKARMRGIAPHSRHREILARPGDVSDSTSNNCDETVGEEDVWETRLVNQNTLVINQWLFSNMISALCLISSF